MEEQGNNFGISTDEELIGRIIEGETDLFEILVEDTIPCYIRSQEAMD